MEYPAWDVENVMLGIEEEDLQDVESYKYSYEENQTVVTGSGKTVRSSPQEAYIFWVMKCVLTERYAHEAYDSDYGVEFLAIMREGYPRQIAESEIRRSVKEALLVDSRTINVTDFRFQWERDSCYITFKVESVYGIETVNVERGGFSSGRVS